MLLFLASYQTSIERHPLLQQANAEDVEGYGVIGDQTGKKGNSLMMMDGMAYLL